MAGLIADEIAGDIKKLQCVFCTYVYVCTISEDGCSRSCMTITTLSVLLFLFLLPSRFPLFGRLSLSLEALSSWPAGYFHRESASTPLLASRSRKRPEVSCSDYAVLLYGLAHLNPARITLALPLDIQRRFRIIENHDLYRWAAAANCRNPARWRRCFPPALLSNLQKRMYAIPSSEQRRPRRLLGNMKPVLVKEHRARPIRSRNHAMS